MNRLDFLATTAAAVAIHRRSPIGAANVYAALGDSTTAYPNRFARVSYPVLLAERYRFHLSPLGINGGVLQTVQQSELPFVVAEPKLLTLGCGINDADKPNYCPDLAAFATRYLAVLAEMRAIGPSAKILVSTIIVNPAPHQPETEARATEFNNSFLRRLSVPGVRVVDIDALPDPVDPSLRALRWPGPAMGNVWHPNDLGHALIAAAFERVIEAASTTPARPNSRPSTARKSQ